MRQRLASCIAIASRCSELQSQKGSGVNCALDDLIAATGFKPWSQLARIGQEPECPDFELSEAYLNFVARVDWLSELMCVTRPLGSCGHSEHPSHGGATPGHVGLHSGHVGPAMAGASAAPAAR